jgi:hypothetical protein
LHSNYQRLSAYFLSVCVENKSNKIEKIAH